MSEFGIAEACRAVSQRAAQTLKWPQDDNAHSSTIALDHLTLGRAALYAAILENCEFRISRFEFRVGLGREPASAAPARRTGFPLVSSPALGCAFSPARVGAESAQEDLDEAWEIAERGPMRLFMADIHLYRARLFGPISGKPKDEGGIEYPWNKNPDGSARGPQDDLEGGAEADRGVWLLAAKRRTRRRGRGGEELVAFGVRRPVGALVAGDLSPAAPRQSGIATGHDVAKR